VTTDHIEASPAKAGSILYGTIRGSKGPGFRRESALVAVSSREGRPRRPLSNSQFAATAPPASTGLAVDRR